ncbi:MAG: RrF2 family transcriptional regulator [Anaerolineales bacterium]
MLRLNRRTDYAIRVLLALSRRGENIRVPTAVIQEEMLIPPVLALQIVAELAKGGFILTHAGRDGGIELARPPHLITLLQVVEYFEGPIHVSECINGKIDCPFDTVCPVRRQWGHLDGIIRTALAKVTFAELAEEARRLEQANFPREEVVLSTNNE